MTNAARRMLCPSMIAAALIIGWTAPALAVDGVILIDQNKALAGNVTPGDLPGFPVSINQPGSYRLTGNLTLPDANTNGIEIHAQNVSIDLNGFAIIGPVMCSETPTIACSINGTGLGIGGFVFANVLVRNGFIQGMGRDGIFMISGVVESVQANQNARYGINVSTGIVRDSIMRDNGQAGLQLGLGMALHNSLYRNPIGLLATPSMSYSGNTFNLNGSNISGAGLNAGQNLCENVICPGAQY